MPWVYILTNKPYGTLYIGSTIDITHRLTQHLSGKGGAFTAKYNLNHLVHLEEYADLGLAQNREKQLKAWRRDWKIALITQANPDWQNLTPALRHGP